jgi:hypothetical protein
MRYFPSTQVAVELWTNSQEFSAAETGFAVLFQISVRDVRNFKAACPLLLPTLTGTSVTRGRLE